MQSKETKTHIPVMLNEAVKALNIKPDGFYIDCTLGEGGHSSEIHKLLNEKGLLLSIDQDQSAIDFVKKYYDTNRHQNWLIYKSNFANINKALKDLKIGRRVDGVLMDLGLSSRQLEIDTRGFSYLEETQSLDMRMDENLSVTAADLINGLNEKELVLLFRKYGEERNALKLARLIKNECQKNKISTVGDLVKIIYKTVPKNNKENKNPARKIFQALRIAVNDELNSLESFLNSANDILNENGRLVIITFHSLEDRIVKEFAKKMNMQNVLIEPSDEEILINKRSHSAKLRILNK